MQDANAGNIGLAKVAVQRYVNDVIHRSDPYEIELDQIFVVWFSKVLQNWKALLSTTIPDVMYYELTYNGDKNELYVDAYKKWQNVCYNPTEDLMAQVAKEMPTEKHDEDTLMKVGEALRNAGMPVKDIPDLVSAMQNAGILFRQRA